MDNEFLMIRAIIEILFGILFISCLLTIGALLLIKIIRGDLKF